MPKALSVIAIMVLLTGCGKKPVPQLQTSNGIEPVSRAELRIGDNPDEPPLLAFKITAIYEKQESTAKPPFYAKGGNWTFFDCQATGDPKVLFTVGVASKGGSGKTPAAWGKARLIVKDREAGGRIVELFSKSFSGKLPKPANRPYVPPPLSINTAILGQNMDREPTGGFSGKTGEWTATKWFLEYDDHSCEVYFNYNLAKRQGEFSEKDADYANDLVLIFASALRDGPRPERTPENDPNLTRDGPTIGKPRKLLARLADRSAFSPKGRFVVYQVGGTIFGLPLDKPGSKPFEIVRFDQSPWNFHVLDEDLTLLADEAIQENPGVISLSCPFRIWWVDRKKGKLLLRGPEKDLQLCEAPVSPNRRYVALHQWRPNPDGKGGTKFVYLLDRNDGTTKTVSIQGKTLTVIGWKETKAGLRAIAVTNPIGVEKNETSEAYLADPATGKLEHLEIADALFDIRNPLSPDGKHRVRLEKHEVVVTDLSNGMERRFLLHEDDRRYVGEDRFIGEDPVVWVSPRYLKFNGPRLALIDVTMMKMCFPATADGTKFRSGHYKFSPDFRWVLYQGGCADGEGFFLAPVEMPKRE